MNRFIIIDGLPFLFDRGKAYAVRWDSNGFTVGAEVALTSAPKTVYNELSIKAQCAGNLDSIGATAAEKAEPEANETEETEKAEPETAASKRKPGRKPSRK